MVARYAAMELASRGGGSGELMIISAERLAYRRLFAASGSTRRDRTLCLAPDAPRIIVKDA
jgi:hypothetical protein